METVWVISASNDWPEIMWRAIDATERDSGPYQNHNLAMALYFFGVASFSLLVLLNLFISVFVCVYLAQSHQQATQLAQGVPQFKTVPKEKPTRPQLPIIKELVITDPFRKKIYDALEAVTAQSCVSSSSLESYRTCLHVLSLGGGDDYCKGNAQEQPVADTNERVKIPGPTPNQLF